MTKLKEFIDENERSKPDNKIAILRTDGGGEFCSNESQKFFKSLGIVHEKSPPYCQYQNGVAERSIDIIDSSARAMVDGAGCQTYDWPFAVRHAVYLRNCVVSTTVTDGCSPNEIFTSVKRER
jgi:transposase InsO family protein